MALAISTSRIFHGNSEAGRAYIAVYTEHMNKYIARRLQFVVLVVIVVTFLSFVLVYLAGDPARSLAGVDSTEADLAQIRQTYGLDRPLPEQYLIFVRDTLRGDLGRSFHFRTEVLPLVLEKFIVTLQLAAASIIISTIVALPLGIISAVRRGDLIDQLATLISLLGISTPGFWLGIILILVFADQLRLLPASGRDEGLKSVILPAVTLSGYTIGLMTSLIRRSMIEELRKPYIVVAKAKGLRSEQVQMGHALRNALIPVVTVAGLQFGAMLGGSIIVENVFAWPGLGQLMLQAIRASDLPVIRAAVLVVAITFVIINLFVDLLYGVIDPRIRFS
jgi:peptide/nickel transport system permease protein